MEIYFYSFLSVANKAENTEMTENLGLILQKEKSTLFNYVLPLFYL